MIYGVHAKLMHQTFVSITNYILQRFHVLLHTLLAIML